MRYIDRNFGKSPFDPDYIDDYDAQEEYDRYLDAVEEKYQARRGLLIRRKCGFLEANKNLTKSVKNKGIMITLEQWQTGEYRNFPEFKTQEGYYEAVSQLVNAYGEPTKDDMYLARSGNYKEFITGKYGASWTPNVNICRNLAKRYSKNTIYWVFIPKGTMAIHLEEKDLYEEEYILDMKGLGLNNRETANREPYSLKVFAKHKGEWDLRSDWETEFDFDRWHLCKTNSIRHPEKLPVFFGEEENS